jgi:hypothetical protein
MRRILLLCLFAALFAAAAPAAWAETPATGASRPVEFSEGRDQAKAVRPQPLCVRTEQQARKVGPPQGDTADQPVVLLDRAPDFKVQRRVALARDARQPPPLTRTRTHSPRAPPIA